MTNETHDEHFLGLLSWPMQEAIQGVKRRNSAREIYYKLVDEIRSTWNLIKIKKIIENIPDLCYKKNLHHVYRQYLINYAINQREKIEDKAAKEFNMPSPISNIFDVEERLLQLIEIRSMEGINALDGNCDEFFSHTCAYRNIFKRQHCDILTVPRKMHNTIKQKIKEIK